MAGKFDLKAVMAAQKSETPRDIETITNEILNLKKMAGEAIIAIGQRLIEAKALLPHGEWLPWLSERVEFSERTAQNFMRISREWSNPQALADLGATKALTLLALPADERDQFISEPHMVDGEERTVIDMSARQLEQAIKERDEARMAAQQAADDQKTAEAARIKLESELSDMKKVLSSAENEKALAEEAALKLESELSDLRARPIDVAVMAVDQEALDKARADAIAEMQEKLDKANEEKAKAKETAKTAKAALAETEAKLEAAVKAGKRAEMAADRDVATFEVLFNQAQEIANKMNGLLIKARGRDNQDVAAKIQAALNALADAIRRAAE